MKGILRCDDSTHPYSFSNNGNFETWSVSLTNVLKRVQDRRSFWSKFIGCPKRTANRKENERVSVPLELLL